MAKPLSPTEERKRRDQYIHEKWEANKLLPKETRKSQTKFAEGLGYKLNTVRDALARVEASKETQE